jgi:hypothetical protein
MTKVNHLITLSQEELEDILFNGRELEYTLTTNGIEIEITIKQD